MKKANLQNLLIIVIIFSLFCIFNIILMQNNIAVAFKIEINEIYKVLLSIGLYVLIMFSSVLYATKSIFNLYIKHNRNIRLNKSRYFLIISSLLTSFLFLILEVKVYYYIVGVILIGFVYFISLYFYDVTYVKKQQKIKLTVNDEIVEKFIELLGHKDNIISVSYEHSRLKVELKDINLVNVEEMKKLGAKGIFIAGNKLQALIGNNAYELEKALKVYFSK